MRCFWNRLLLVAALALLATHVPAQAAKPPPRLNVRLLAAETEPRTTQAKQKALADVVPMLQRVFRFPAYKLLAQREAVLRAGLKLNLARALTLTVTKFSGSQLTVELHRLKNRKKQRVLQTTVKLVAAKPVVLGGFKDADGTTLIVVLALAPLQLAEGATPGVPLL